MSQTEIKLSEVRLNFIDSILHYQNGPYFLEIDSCTFSSWEKRIYMKHFILQITT